MGQKYPRTRFGVRSSVIYGEGLIKEHPVTSVLRHGYFFVEHHFLINNSIVMPFLFLEVYFQDSQKSLFIRKLIKKTGELDLR